MMKIKQGKPRQWLGGLISMYTASGIVLTPFTYLGLATTVWNTGGRVFLLQYVPWFTFPMFIGISVAFGLCLMLSYWKFIYPSIIAFGNHQGWQHDNPMKDYMIEMNKILEEIRNGHRKETEELVGDGSGDWHSAPVQESKDISVC